MEPLLIWSIIQKGFEAVKENDPVDRFPRRGSAGESLRRAERKQAEAQRKIPSVAPKTKAPEMGNFVFVNCLKGICGCIQHFMQPESLFVLRPLPSLLIFLS